MAEIDYKEIVARVLTGDTRAYDRLIEALTCKMLRYAESITRDRRRAEEAVQDAFVDCYLHLSSLREPNAFEGFLAMTVKRKCFRRPSGFDCEDIFEYAGFLPDREELPEDCLIRTEEQSVVRAAIVKLPPALREATKLFYLDGCSVKETAKSLGVPEATVRRRLHDAREKLQKELIGLTNKNTKDIENKIKESIQKIKKYRMLYGEDDTYQKSVEELSPLIKDVEDERMQKFYKAEQLRLTTFDTGVDQEEAQKELDRAADAGEHPLLMERKLYTDAYRLFNMGDELGKKRAEYWEKTALPALEKCKGLPGYEEAVGKLLIHISLSINRYDLDQSIRLLERALDCFGEDDFEKSCVKTALETYKESCKRSALPDMGMIDGTCRLGISPKGIRCARSMGHNILYQQITQEHTSSSFFVPLLCGTDQMLLHAGAKQGDVFETSKRYGDADEKDAGTATYTARYLSDGETVTVPAGTFENCTHIRNERGENSFEDNRIDFWFKDGVGLLKYVYTDAETSETYELAEYDLHGGTGLLPLHIGNRWLYRENDLPKALESRHEYRVSRVSPDGAFYDLSYVGLTYIPKAEDRGINIPDSDVCLAIVSKLCRKWKLEEALAYLRAAIRANTNEKAVAAAVYAVPLMEEYVEYQKRGFRFLPGHIRSHDVAADGNGVTEENGQDCVFPISRYGSRGKYEDRIFGVKPFRYLDLFTGHYWSSDWKPGYKKEIPFTYWDGSKTTVFLTVEDGGTVALPCGTFENCLKLTFDAEMDGERSDDYYLNWNDGYRFQWCGKKEYWFAPGVGIVRFVCTWGKHISSEMILQSCAVPGSDGKEYFPLHIGTRWEYVETHLTKEGYRAAFCVSVPNGFDGKFQWIQSQEFVYLGTTEEYRKKFFNT